MESLLVSAATLIEILDMRATISADRIAYSFLPNRGRNEVSITYAQLRTKVRVIAHHLQNLGQAGERVALFYPPGLEYIAAFLGCLAAGMVAVPLYPPRNNQKLERVLNVFQDCGARLALTSAAQQERIAAIFEEAGQFPPCLHSTCHLQNGLAERFHPLALRSTDLAYLQYTSGSTGCPKGVMLSHGNLMVNQRAITGAIKATEADVGLSWLPMYHDMGLVFGVLHPLYRGYRGIYMAPLDFIRDPISWLELISRYGVTLAGAPSFAYELCVQKASTDQIGGLDLHTWRVAFNGSEPIRAGTLERFSQTFAAARFAASAHFPCYGLAEATLFVSGQQRETGPRRLKINRDALKDNLAVLDEDGELTLVNCGVTHEQGEILIVDPRTRRVLAEQQIGEIWLAGDHVAAGYWGKPEQTEQIFCATTSAGVGPYLRTGDLGFLYEGHLYLTGRYRDLVIIRGRNYYPQDLEYAATACNDVFCTNAGAAFTVHEAGEDHLVMVLEVERCSMHSLDAQQAAADVRAAIASEFEIVVHRVVLVGPGVVPKTSSGKTRRGHCHELLVSGKLVLLSSQTTSSGMPAGSPEEEMVPVLRALRHLASEVLRIPVQALPLGEDLNRMGLNSLSAIRFMQEAQSRLAMRVNITQLLHGASLRELAEGAIHAPLAALSSQPITGQPLPLSCQQKAFYFLDRISPEPSVSQLCFAASNFSLLDVEKLEWALSELLERHPILRTSLHLKDGQLVQKVAETQMAAFETVDGANWSREKIAAHLDEIRQRRFKLTEGPLLHLHLLSLSARHHVLQINISAMVCDLWSLMLLMDDLGVLYEKGEANTLASPDYHYGHFVAWQRNYLGQQGQLDRQWWMEQLAGAPTIFSLPQDRPRPAERSFAGAIAHFQVSPNTIRAVRQLAAEANTTVFTVLYAAFATLLSRYSGCDDILIGTPTCGRARGEFQDVVGHFSNHVVLRANLKPDPTGGSARCQPGFRVLVMRSARVVSEALAHSHYPFIKLVEDLCPPRDPSRSPLFQVMFQLHRANRLRDPGAFVLGEIGEQLHFGGLDLHAREQPQRVASFDLSLQMSEQGDHMAAIFAYNTDLFDQATIERVSYHFQCLLAAAVSHPEAPLDHISMDNAGLADRLSMPARLEAGPARALELLHYDHACHRRCRAVELDISAHPDVDGVCVPPRRRGKPLAAYYVGRVDRPELLGFLMKKAPTRVPAGLVRLQALPRTPGGLVDVATLGQLPIVDDALLAGWRETLAGMVDNSEFLVMAYTNTRLPQRLPLRSVVPELTPAFAQESNEQTTAAANATANLVAEPIAVKEQVGQESSLPAWFYRSCWRKLAIQGAVASVPGVTLLFSQDTELSLYLQRGLERGGSTVVVVSPGDVFQAEGQHYKLNPTRPEDFEALIDALRVRKQLPTEVIHLLCHGSEPVGLQQDLHLGVYCVSWLVRALAMRLEACAYPRILLCTSHACGVISEERPSPARAALVGLVGCIAAEMPGLAVSLVDLPAETPETDVTFIWRERLARNGRTRVAWRAGARWAPALVPVMRKKVGGSTGLREGGQYLITGGLGPASILLARYLLKHYKANLVLAGKCLEPDLNEDARQELELLQQEPGTITYVAVDVCNHRSLKLMAKVFLQDVSAIFHLETNGESRSFAHMDKHYLDRVLAARVWGTTALHNLQLTSQASNGSVPLVCFSTLNGYFGAAGVAASAAASAFQEAFCQEMGSSGWCLGFGPWPHQTVPGPTSVPTASSSYSLPICAKQALHSFLAVLAAGERQAYIGLDETCDQVAAQLEQVPLKVAQVVIFIGARDRGRHDCLEVTDRFGTATRARWSALERLPRTSGGAIDEEALQLRLSEQATCHVKRPPISETERSLARIWQEVLGVTCHLDENFFEQGGTSLLGMTMLDRIATVFKVLVPAKILFARPTIGELALWLETLQA